jgi:glycolate oxidase FAD binding subunit
MIELRPATLEEAGADLARAARDKLRVALLGGGTQVSRAGRRAPVDATLRTGAMARILDYAPADMVLAAEAGVTLEQVQAAARDHRQMLALDPPNPGRSTIGGLVATGGFGPHRTRYGAVRDLIIGVTLVLADGTVARGGGKVVKNVAGFDLPKIACGSHGTLGLVARATFRLHPLPEATASAVVLGCSAGHVAGLRATLRRAQLEPSSVVALRAEDGRLDVTVRFEGFGAGVQQQVARFVDLARAERVADDAVFVRRHDAIRTGGPLRLRVATRPSHLDELEEALAPLLASLSGAGFAWYPMLGVGFVAGDPGPGTFTAMTRARAALVAGGGWLVVEDAPDPPASPADLDAWGPAPPSFAIMRELKARFDPDHRLNAGRFVGGL